MSPQTEGFREMGAWQVGMEIAQGAYRLSGQLPQEEMQGLVAQMRRAAISLPANIAKGFRKRYEREYRQYLHASLGASAELETYLELAKRLYALDGEPSSELATLLGRFQGMANDLIRKPRP